MHAQSLGLLVSSSANQVFYFLCLVSSAWKQTAAFWEDGVFCWTQSNTFFLLPFQGNTLTCIQISELSLIQMAFPIGFVLSFNTVIPPHSHLLRWCLGTLWSLLSLFLSLELLSSATSHKAARTRLLLEAKGDRGIHLFLILKGCNTKKKKKKGLF